MKKRLLSLLLALVMLVGMIPATTLTASAESNYSVWVGGVKMTSGTYLAVGATATQTTKPSGGYAYYEDGTLTLNNYSYEGEGRAIGGDQGYIFYAIVYAEHDLTVELVGTNTLAQTEIVSDVIYVHDADLTIDGNGKLIGTSPWRCLCAYGDLTINGGTIAVTSEYQSIMSSWGNVTINGGDIIAETTLTGFCIDAHNDLTINGGNVTAISVNSYAGYGRSITIAKDLHILASTTADGELVEYSGNISFCKKIVITGNPTIINNVNVSATFSGTPADATTSTTGATVTATKWYKKNGSSWTELGASDTIKEGYTYRCEVTVGTTAGYKLADGYTVKINGTAATNQSGNTWYRDVTITGYTDYVDVQDIALPEAGVHPDFTYNDVECRHSSVALVEWFECDKDGKKLSGALSADYKFKEDSYYRLEVTVVPDANYMFFTRDLSFFIGPKAVQYYYPYQDTTYPGSVTGWKVYHVDDANGTYTVQIGDITLKDGDYLANNATSVTTVKPVGGYAYYKDGVLTLNNFVAAKLVRYYERYLEVELIGENKIGAIADYYYWDTTSNDYFTGLEFRGTGNLEFYEYYGHPYCNISVNGDVIFNGSGDILLDAENYCFQYTDNVIINDGYVYCYTSMDSVFGDDTIIEVNGGKLQMFDGGCWDSTYICNGTFIITAGDVFVGSNRAKLEDCDPWDGVTNLNTYDTIWIVDEQATVTHTVTFKVDTTTVATKTVENGKTVTAPADPTQSGKTFLGWYNGSTKFDFTTPITGDITLTAKYEQAATILKGDVNLDGVVDMEDTTKLMRHVLNAETITDANALAAAEVTGNDSIDMEDVAKLMRYVLKAIDSLD